MVVNTLHFFRTARRTMVVALLATALGGTSVTMAQVPLVTPVLAQTTNQSYDCGSYGAGNYGSNDCLATAATPTPPPAAASTSQSGGLPGTGAQLVWLGVIGLALILGGIVLSRRRRRHPSSAIH